jgi:hypothetical protein
VVGVIVTVWTLAEHLYRGTSDTLHPDRELPRSSHMDRGAPHTILMLSGARAVMQDGRRARLATPGARQ